MPQPLFFNSKRNNHPEDLMLQDVQQCFDNLLEAFNNLKRSKGQSNDTDVTSALAKFIEAAFKHGIQLIQANPEFSEQHGRLPKIAENQGTKSQNLAHAIFPLFLSFTKMDIKALPKKLSTLFPSTRIRHNQINLPSDIELNGRNTQPAKRKEHLEGANSLFTALENLVRQDHIKGQLAELKGFDSDDNSDSDDPPYDSKHNDHNPNDIIIGGDLIAIEIIDYYRAIISGNSDKHCISNILLNQQELQAMEDIAESLGLIKQKSCIKRYLCCCC